MSILIGKYKETTQPTEGFRIRNVKLEKGNKATDWSPAPEDKLSEGVSYAGVEIDATNGFVSTATIDSKDVKVQMSATTPYKLSIEGASGTMQDYIYVTDSSGFSGANILVTSLYDVNEDGVVDDRDVKLVVDYYLGVPGSYPDESRMDVNDSGSVNAIDATLVMRNSSVRDKISTSGGKQLGVDSTGIWMSSNWGDTKTYIHTF